ncbi:MAG: hypothetical protein RL199_508 [Pseudomonadota bacterium]|jgi:hypothetical protein
MRLTGPALAAALAAACGNGPSLSNLRCDGDCQDVADPFLMKLVVDYEDPDGTLASCTLGVTVGGRPAASHPLDAKVAPTANGSGTISFDAPLRPARIKDGDTFEVDVEATGRDGATNSVRRSFTFHL